mmetsp:Transcript_142212/g.201224  ORF Transcript_142212/g.201224 Transcript_142212/m.201224 type:complete len:239 (-) Transcript_142212:40-756(-)
MARSVSPQPAGFDHGSLTVIIPCQDLDKLRLILACHKERGLQHLQEGNVQHSIAVAVTKASVGCPNREGGEAVIFLVMLLQPLEVCSNPRVCAIGPVRKGNLPPGHVVGLKGQCLKVDLHIVEHRDHRDAIVPVVVGAANPLDQLCLCLDEDVVVHGIVHDNGYAHPTCLELIDDHVDHTVPGRELVIDPQAVDATRLHQVQLLPDHLALVLIIKPQVALVERVSDTPMVIQARSPDA